MIRDYVRRLRRGAARATAGTSATDRAVSSALRDCGLFDGAWYLARYPDVASAGVDPLEHFLASGMAEGRDPHPLFSTAFYRRTNPDVGGAGVAPLAHFILTGGAENRQPHPLVAPGWLRGRLGAPSGGGDLPFDNPLLGLLMNRQGVGPRPLFDVAHVAGRLGLAADSAAGQVLSAWFARGVPDRPDPHPLFCSAWLRDVTGAAPGTDMVERYCLDFGKTLSPHPLFDAAFVMETLPATRALASGMTLLDQVLATAGPVATTALIDAAHYHRQPGADRSVLPALHYVTQGSARGLDPNPWFDDALYRQRYGALLDGRTPLEHYARHGREHWVTLAPRFPDRFYAARYPDSQDGFAGTPLAHFLTVGRAGHRMLAQPAWTDDFDSWDAVRAEVRAGAARLGSADPEVSVIVPVYNQFLFTLRCLWSILRAGDTARLQVIVADDGSDDETAAFFGALPGITYVRNPQNMGFLRSCNHAATLGRAPYLFLLNNDTAVLPGWIDQCLSLARATPDAGIIGAKLVYPDGTLQEAGGYVWSDGGGANLGRASDPQEPGFNLRRDADYISGAAILVPRAVWDQVGGFDTRYVPAYCEDTDLAMRLRSLGWRVIYQPAATVVHFEGVSSGTSTETGVKAHQVTNFAKLRERWAFALENHLPAQAVHHRRVPRPPRPRILMIDHRIPEPDKDAGSVVAMWHLRLLTDLGYEVTFLPRDLRLMGPYGRAVQALGVEVLHTPYVTDIKAYLAAHARDFDAFWLVRYGEGGAFIEDLRGLCPGTPVILNTADLHFLRMEREARRAGNLPEAVQAAAEVKLRELRVIELATETIIVSTHERDLLAAMGGPGSLSVVPLVLEPAADVAPFAGRSGIAFVGGYQHTPNVDAVLHFLDTIWPLLRERAPDLRFHIVGSHPPPEIEGLKLPGVVVHGHVPDLDGFLAQRLATVVPLTYGAGIKGKIGSSLAQGVPCVSSPVGAEGMGLADGTEVLIADAPGDFADAVLRVTTDAALWQRLSDGGRAFVAREYAPGVTRRRLLRVLAKAGVAPFTGACAVTGMPEVRRFLSGNAPDSLSRGAGAPGSAERVAAAALARWAGHPGAALAAVPAGALAGVALYGDLPNIARLAGMAADAASATVMAARVPLDGTAGATVDAVLAGLTASVTRLVIACPPVGQPPGEARAEAPRLAALVRRIEAAGWEVRTDRLALAECALTGCALIEARRVNGALRAGAPVD